MANQFTRTELLFGSEAMEKLYNAHVAVFGVGGVGGYAVEALARSGVGTFDIIDNDTVALSNINRQIIATHDTIDKFKVDVMCDRIHSINPEAIVNVHKCFFLPENEDTFDFTQYDYVVDAVDTVAAKIAIVMKAKAANVPVISSMGAGNKVNPAMFEVADIYKTSVCPLARVMRQAMKKRGVKSLKVVYSKELPITPLEAVDISEPEHQIMTTGETPEPIKRRSTPGSNAFTPSVAGLIIASEVVKDLIAYKGK